MRLPILALIISSVLCFNTISIASECPAGSNKYCSSNNQQYCCGSDSTGYYCAEDANHCTQ